MSSSSDAAVMSAAEYSEQVSQWLQQAYRAQMLAAGFPTYLAYQASLQRASQNRANTPQPPPAAVVHSGPPPMRLEFKIPPLWKRFAAEFVDFWILLVVKLAVTFVAVDTFELIDFDK